MTTSEQKLSRSCASAFQVSTSTEAVTSSYKGKTPSSLSSSSMNSKLSYFTAHIHKLNTMEAASLSAIAQMKSIEFAGFSKIFNDLAKDLRTTDELYWTTTTTDDESGDDKHSDLLGVTKAMISTFEKRANRLNYHSPVLLASASDENNEALGFSFQEMSERFRVAAAHLQTQPPDSIRKLMTFIKSDLKKRYRHLKGLRKRHAESSLIVAFFLKKYAKSLEELVQATRSFAHHKFSFSASVHVKSWDIPQQEKQEVAQSSSDMRSSQRSAVSLDPTSTSTSNSVGSGSIAGMASGCSVASNIQWAEDLLPLDLAAGDPVKQPTSITSKKKQGITSHELLARRLDDVLSRSNHGCIACVFSSRNKSKCTCGS